MERGAAELSPLEEGQWRAANNAGRPRSVYAKNRELEDALKFVEKSCDLWRKKYREAVLTSNNAYSDLKISNNALNALRGQHGPLLNALTNLAQEVEMCSTAVGALTLKKEQEEIRGDVILTHTVGAQGTLDRYLVEPARREGMSIIRTEKFAVGTGETHVLVRGCYGNPKTPWGDLPLMSKHMIASQQEMEQLKSSLNKMAQHVAQSPHSSAGGSSSSGPNLPNWPKRPRPQSVVVVPPNSTLNRAPRPPVSAPPPLPPLPPRPPLPSTRNPRPVRPPAPRPPSLPAGAAAAPAVTVTYRGDSSELEVAEQVMVE